MRRIFVLMIGATPYLLVYGTLLNKDNEFGAFLRRNAVFAGKAKFKGLLYDLGDYPGAILLTEADSFVFGSIFRLDNAEEVLKQLDNYEGFGEDQPQPNLFVRELIAVETNGQILNCWVYLYNLPIDGHRLIASGHYLPRKKFSS